MTHRSFFLSVSAQPRCILKNALFYQKNDAFRQQIRLPNMLVGFLLFTFSGSAQTVIDIDGNSYHTIAIGTQVWMKENLQTTHFNNGDPIPTYLGPVSVDTSSLYQWPYNDDSNNVDIYGRLYTWFTATNTKNVCPSGWHVPDHSDWATLADFLGGAEVAGSKMKEIGLTHWSATDSTVDNSSMFTGLPGGFRGNPSGFNNFGLSGSFWSATPFGSATFQRGINYRLNANDGQLVESVAVANCGLSIRCIKNQSVAIANPTVVPNVRIFPNPASQSITVSVNNWNNSKLFIYNLLGNLVLQQQIVGENSEVGISSLAGGTYLLLIVGENRLIERKFVKN